MTRNSYCWYHQHIFEEGYSPGDDDCHQYRIVRMRFEMTEPSKGHHNVTVDKQKYSYPDTHKLLTVIEF